MDRRMGGYMTISSRTGKPVWSCMQCHWIHKPKAAKLILEELKKLGADAPTRELQALRFKLWLKLHQGCEPSDLQDHRRLV